MLTSGNLFGWSDAVWLLLDQISILVGDVLMAASLIGAVVGWLRRDAIRRWLVRNRFPEVGGEFAAAAQRWDGLVFTVSKEDVPRWVMEQVKPERVAFVCSTSLHSRDAADALAKHAEKLGIVHPMIREVDADDPAASRRAAAAAIEELRQAGCAHIGVDVTGGKTPMSLGAFMAAEEQGADTLYVATEYDQKLNKPRPETARILRISESG